MGTNDELLLKVRADTDKATKELSKLTKEVKKLSKGVKTNSKTMKLSEKSFNGVAKATSNFNTQLVALASTYLSFQGAKKLVLTTAEVEAGFIGIAKTTGLVGREFEELEKSLLDMSTSMAGVELSGLQAVAETAGQLGITGVDNILEFTRVISMMGTATDLSAEEAAIAMADLGESLNIPIKDFERLGSVINEVSNNSSANARQIVSYAQRISGVGKTFGLTADEIIAFSATLKAVGVSAELGGTALSKVMLEMLKDTEAFAKASGVSFEEFSKLMADEPVKALELFIQSIGKLDKFEKIKALDDLGLKSSQVTQTMLKLSSATGLLTKNLKLSGDEWIRNTSLQKEYETAASGLEAQWTRVENALTVLGYKIGKELLPMFKELIDDTVKWLDALDDGAIESFGQGIGKLFEGLVGIGKTIAFLNDILMPDWLGGEDAGFFDTAIGGWTRLYEAITRAGDAMSAIEDADKLVGDVDKIESAVQGFDGLNTSYRELSTTLEELLAKNLSLQETFRSNGSEEARAQIEALRLEEERLFSISEQLATQRPFDQTEDDAKKAADAIAETGKEADKLNGTDVDIRVDADTENYAQKMARLRKESEEKHTVVTVEADTKSADASIAVVKKPTQSTLTVQADTRAAQTAINALKVPTFSTHTVTVREVHARAKGGLLPQRPAVGGTFKGSGRVPGYDPTDGDKVNAFLTGGENVTNRRASGFYGQKMMDDINMMRFPKIPGYADGGLVGGTSSSSTSPAQTPINLNIGGNSFGMLAPREVAEALQIFINSEGGL